MNDVATELQADDTHAVNPSGLDAPASSPPARTTWPCSRGPD